MKNKKLRCTDCRDGGHENYSEKIELVTVKNPDTGKIHKRAYLCDEHQAMYQDDGYYVYY